MIKVRCKNAIIVVTMKSMEEKRRIMKQKSKLEKGVYIDDDLTRKEREIQQHIRRLARERKEKGEYIKIGYKKLEEELRKGQVGGIVVGERKVWSVTYADDIVLMADREKELKQMLKRFEKFLKETELELSTEKTKMVVFEKRKNKKRQRKWK